MSEELQISQNPGAEEEKNSFLARLEREFDWNLIGIVSIWLFLFATFFLIFVKP